MLADKEQPKNGARCALVLGATGGLGGAVARTLLGHGWQVRALTRDIQSARRTRPELAAVDWRQGDAMLATDVLAAARGAAVLIHGANPPRYQRWRELAMPMLANSIAAAGASGARLVFPGNIYNFGPDARPLLDESAPQHPSTGKGAVRVEMEQMLAVGAASGARALVVRAGDFFGAKAPSSWFSSAMVRPGRALRSINFPGTAQVGHAWAYLPDLAEAIAQLVDREASLPPFDTFHFAGHWTEHSIEMAQVIRRAAGRPTLPIRRIPWPLLKLAAPFSGFARELVEMRYLWQVAMRLDNRKLVAALGAEPHTPLIDAVRQSLVDLRCIAS
jgi:nucleoside-diphosphate-sugar epimerase